jgi:hypothetical protein
MSYNRPVTRSDPTLTGRCLGCDYLLRDLPTPRCPECGRPFDPLDPTTMRTGRAGDDLRRWFFARLGWQGVLVTAFPMLLLVWVFSSPGPYYMGLIMVFVIGALALVPTAALTARASGGKVRRGTLLIVTVLTCASVVFVELPLRVRFALSIPAMNRLLLDVRANPDAPQPQRRWVGLYEIGEVRPPRSGGLSGSGITRFYEPGSLENGFAYSDTPIRGYPGINPGAGGHLFGGWYWFSDD